MSPIARSSSPTASSRRSCWLRCSPRTSDCAASRSSCRRCTRSSSIASARARRLRSAMREAFVIAKREFIERVRTKWFVAMTILGPVLMIALIVIPVLLAGKGTHGAKIEIVDETGVLGDALVKKFADDSQHWNATLVPATTPDKELLDHIKHKKISGFLRVPNDALAHGKIVYRGDNATNQMVLGTLYK